MLRQQSGDVLEWTRYTRAEIRAHWEMAGNRARESSLTQPVPHEHAALQLCALWLRRVCGIPVSHYYDREARCVRFFLGFAADADTSKALLSRLALALELLGWQWDEQGRLFAEEGPFEVDVPKLVRLMVSVRERLETVGEHPVAAEIDLALREGYVGL